MNDILVLYYSRNGATRALAQAIAQGVDSVPGMQARVRTVPLSPPFAKPRSRIFPPTARPTPKCATWKNAPESRSGRPRGSATWRLR